MHHSIVRMIEVATERIWTLSKNDVIAPRKGTVTIDSDEYIVNENDAIRPILVADGLHARDFAVFLRLGDGQKQTIAGFLIGATEDDGSGVIVHSTMVEQAPKFWTTDRINKTWSYLAHIEPAIYDDFSMHALGTYLKTRC